MSITLVEQGHNRLRYLVVDEGAALVITTTGAASPDLLTDSLAGPIKVCANAFTTGLGILPAGALTQAQSRAIWMADNSDTVLGNVNVPRALVRLVARSGTSQHWTIDADVDGGGHPVINIASNTQAGGGECYVDVETQGAIGI